MNVSKPCCVCGGLTAPNDVNNWICGACWERECSEGIPSWVEFLRRASKYEVRRDLCEFVRRDKNGIPTVRLTRNREVPFSESFPTFESMERGLFYDYGTR